MRKKILCAVLTAALAAASLTACGSTAEERTEAATVEEITTETVTETETETEEETTFATTEEATEAEGNVTLDRAGNEIIIPENVERIVSMAPSTTRVLIDLGLADKIVAIDTNSYEYIEVLPTGIQQFDMMSPDNEALVALEPDIIFTSGMSSFGGEDVYQPARDAGACVADIPSSTSFESIAEDIIFIGTLTGKDAEAAAIAAEFLDEVEIIKAAAAEGVDEPKTVLFEISLPSADYPTIYTCGTGTFIDEMITDLNAVNVVGDQESWVAISEEDAIALNPDVIVTNVDYVEDAVGTIKSAPGWEEVTAIKNGDVYYIDSTASNQPNQHVIEAMLQLAKALYPDVFEYFEIDALDDAA